MQNHPTSAPGQPPGDALTDAGIPPLAPGVFLVERLLPDLGIDIEEAAGIIDMPIHTMLKIVDQRKSVTEPLAAKLVFLDPVYDKSFWLDLQATVDNARLASAGS
jgi:addiction module HigA family antidote